MKLRLIYSYNGAKFSGSQTQPEGTAVEDALERALAKVGVFGGVLSSSRTDKGVHALRQVSTVEVGEWWRFRLDVFKREVNKHLCGDVVLGEVSEVSESFQVRFDASARSYRYVLFHGKKSPFLEDFVFFCEKPNLKRLNLALKAFVGEHDFSGFYKLGSDEKSPVRHVFEAFAYERGEMTFFKFKANGFLRSQVRLMVANALKAAQSEANLSRFLSSFSPLTKMPAPASGLYLVRVFYVRNAENGKRKAEFA